MKTGRPPLAVRDRLISAQAERVERINRVDAGELLPAAEESCVPWVVEEFALEEGTRVVTALAAAVLLPEVEAAAPAVVVLAAPWT